jgi:hypothetical protein
MSSRLDKRLEKINRLNDLKYKENREMERLKRKKSMIQDSISENYILKGNQEELELQLKKIKKEKKDKQQNIKNIIKILLETSKKYYIFKSNIRRLEQLTYMEQDIQFYKTFILKKKIHAKISKWNNDSLLINIKNIIPTDIINYICEFFLYETKCNLLESKYNPLKIINKLSIININKIISIIFCQDILNCSDILDNETKEIIILKYETFYNCKVDENINKRIKRNYYDTRIFFKNIILSFRPNCFQILYGLYKLIVLLYKSEIK